MSERKVKLINTVAEKLVHFFDNNKTLLILNLTRNIQFVELLMDEDDHVNATNLNTLERRIQCRTSSMTIYEKNWNKSLN